jgi:flagellar protein FlaF
MYQSSYADILADDAGDARARERQTLDQAVVLLRHAADGAPGGAAEVKALDFTTELWALFIRDLAHPGNAMPDRLKADLMSIGLGVMAECDRVAAGTSRDLDGLADICGVIRDGLK